MAHLYRYIPIWRRVQNGAVLYRVFEVVGIGFTVQSKDFFPAQAPVGAQASLEAQFLELLIEQDPHDRFGTSATIETAVSAFDQYFESTADT
ncbi:MAG TPA: hypothetical protein DD456_04920 [Stenotrophomonas sp.]|nr:hypothetical protein [Stenotrophomonas sp.]